MDESQIERANVNAVDLLEAVEKELGGRWSNKRYSVDTFCEVLRKNAAKLISKTDQAERRRRRALI